MVCSTKNCSDGSISTPLYACFGPCGNLYHAKCIGSTNGFIEKISNSKFAYWYCPDCRELSISTLAFKMSSFKADILKLSKGFEELLNVFNTAVSNLNSFSITNSMVNNSTSTDDLVPDLPPYLISSHDDDILAQSGSGINKAHVRTQKVNKKRRRDNSSNVKNSGPSPKRTNLNTNPHPIAVLPDPTQPVASTTTVASTNIIKAVSKPRSIFVSRLDPNTSPDDIISHLVSCKSIPSTASVKCTKISNKEYRKKKEAPVASKQPSCNSIS
ncbi:uncharacterized protein LOC129909347 [Episyrphus balteatus]|uniref:uncharacterized protein LOC129909347 n=1 Tax=Episyrphus balteatus TaxID=286459 RepID=UPI0024861A73|nr:uncharacterized protein LOC129909347 [Episyrphus balteatus]